MFTSRFLVNKDRQSGKITENTYLKTFIEVILKLIFYSPNSKHIY